jgi:DNA-binding LacI/PurR family transcriptional regulator
MRPTLADVAAEAGVSVALASIVMRGAPGAGAATRERVQEVARRLGYRPDSRARLLRSGRSRLLGVVFDVRHPFHDDLLTGLYDAAAKAGYQLTLSAVTARRDERTAVDGLLQDRCEALILFSSHLRTRELAEIAGRLPLITMMRAVRHRSVDVVHNDESRGSHQAVDHLVGCGHQRIAHIDGGTQPGSSERRDGYLTAMRHHGLDAHIQVIPGGPGEDDGARAATHLFPGSPTAGATAGSFTGPPAARTASRNLADSPTAVTVFNDLAATGVLAVARRRGLDVPGDLSVVGYDDSSFSRLAHIDLTTVAQDVDAMATHAVSRAVARIEGTEVTRREVIVEPRLIPRGTTAPVTAP